MNAIKFKRLKQFLFYLGLLFLFYGALDFHEIPHTKFHYHTISYLVGMLLIILAINLWKRDYPYLLEKPLTMNAFKNIYGIPTGWLFVFSLVSAIILTLLTDFQQLIIT